MHLFRKLPRLVIRDGSVTLPGKRYNLDRVLYAYGELIDHLSTRFNRGASVAEAPDWSVLKGEVQWPHPDKDRVLKAWRHYAANYDALGSCITHRIGQLYAHAFVLGRHWTVYHPDRNDLTSSAGGDPLALDHGPCVEIGGRPNGPHLTGLNDKGYELVRGIILGDLAKFGFVVTTDSLEAHGTFSVTVKVHFPHGIYGAGEDWLRVRCLAPDGGELVPNASPD